MSNALTTTTKMFERAMGFGRSAAPHVEQGAKTVRAVGEGAVVGALLGVGDAVLSGGLDLKIGMMGAPGSQFPAVPVDLAVALVGAVGAIGFAKQNGIAPDLRNAATAASGVFAFRKMGAYVRAKQGVSSSSVQGEFGSETSIDGADDPIVELAKTL